MFAAGGPGRHLGGGRITRPLDLSAVAPLPSRQTPRWRHRIGVLDRFGRLQIPEIAELDPVGDEELRLAVSGGELLLAYRSAGVSPVVDGRCRLTIPSAIRLEWGPRAAAVVSLAIDHSRAVIWPVVRLDDLLEGR